MRVSRRVVVRFLVSLSRPRTTRRVWVAVSASAEHSPTRTTERTSPMTTARTATVASRLASLAEGAGIALDLITVTPDGVGVYATDQHLTAALAVELGLTRRTVTTDGARETFSGVVEGVRVVTSGPVPVPERPRVGRVA